MLQPQYEGTTYMMIMSQLYVTGATCPPILITHHRTQSVPSLCDAPRSDYAPAHDRDDILEAIVLHDLAHLLRDGARVDGDDVPRAVRLRGQRRVRGCTSYQPTSSTTALWKSSRLNWMNFAYVAVRTLSCIITAWMSVFGEHC